MDRLFPQHDFERPIIGDYAYKYKATRAGQVFSFTYGKWREIKGSMKYGSLMIKLKLPTGKYFATPKRKLIFEAFRGKTWAGYVLTNRNGNPYDCSLKNIKAITYERNTRQACRARSRPVIQVDEAGVIINSWPSVYQASQDLYVSKTYLLRMIKGEHENYLRVAFELTGDLALSDRFKRRLKG